MSSALTLNQKDVETRCNPWPPKALDIDSNGISDSAVGGTRIASLDSARVSNASGILISIPFTIFLPACSSTSIELAGLRCFEAKLISSQSSCSFALVQDWLWNKAGPTAVSCFGYFPIGCAS